jgi:hypothetical protein
MQDRHVDLYLGSKRDDFGWCETTPQYLPCNFNYKALGTKARSGWRYCGSWYATSGLVMTLVLAKIANKTLTDPVSKFAFSIEPIVLHLPHSHARGPLAHC